MPNPVRSPASTADVKVYHVVGESQYQGSCRMHLFPDCCHLVRPRRWGPMDMTGATETTTLPAEGLLENRRVCRLCSRRSSRVSGGPLSLPRP